MKYDRKTYPKGHTLDEGTYVFLDLAGIRGQGLWSGKQLRPPHRKVIISFRSLHMPDELDAILRYDAPGIAPVLFIGAPDEYRPHPVYGAGRRHVAVVEARPEGELISDTGPLEPSELVRLGLGLCDTIMAWAERSAITQGLRPETVYVTGDPGHRRFAGATPRAFLFLGNDGYAASFPPVSYDPPASVTGIGLELADVLFTTVMILWFALLREHPYDVPGQPFIDNNTWNDVRRPFTGPPELGRLFERVLVADLDRRMKAAEFRDELEKLARAWNVELPPFPPPGLVDP